MKPFKVYDRENKTSLLVINYHTKSNQYLVAREDDSEQDGELFLIDAQELCSYRMLDFYEIKEV